MKSRNYQLPHKRHVASCYKRERRRKLGNRQSCGAKPVARTTFNNRVGCFNSYQRIYSIAHSGKKRPRYGTENGIINYLKQPRKFGVVLLCDFVEIWYNGTEIIDARSFL